MNTPKTIVYNNKHWTYEKDIILNVYANEDEKLYVRNGKLFWKGKAKRDDYRSEKNEKPRFP